MGWTEDAERGIIQEQKHWSRNIAPLPVSLHIPDKISLEKIRWGGSDPYFPRARAPKYSMERGRAYLLSSEWVQEYPRRYGRHTRSQGPDSNRSRIAGCIGAKAPIILQAIA